MYSVSFHTWSENLGIRFSIRGFRWQWGEGRLRDLSATTHQQSMLHASLAFYQYRAGYFPYRGKMLVAVSNSIEPFTSPALTLIGEARGRVGIYQSDVPSVGELPIYDFSGLEISIYSVRDEAKVVFVVTDPIRAYLPPLEF